MSSDRFNTTAKLGLSVALGIVPVAGTLVHQGGSNRLKADMDKFLVTVRAA